MPLKDNDGDIAVALAVAKAGAHKLTAIMTTRMMGRIRFFTSSPPSVFCIHTIKRRKAAKSDTVEINYSIYFCDDAFSNADYSIFVHI